MWKLTWKNEAQTQFQREIQDCFWSWRSLFWSFASHCFADMMDGIWGLPGPWTPSAFSLRITFWQWNISMIEHRTSPFQYVSIGKWFKSPKDVPFSSIFHSYVSHYQRVDNLSDLLKPSPGGICWVWKLGTPLLHWWNITIFCLEIIEIPNFFLGYTLYTPFQTISMFMNGLENWCLKCIYHTYTIMYPLVI